MQPDLHLDLSGLNCPLPILLAKKALAGLTSGCGSVGYYAQAAGGHLRGVHVQVGQRRHTLGETAGI